MPGINGLEVARRITSECHVVFITAFEQYAIEAFEQAAIDYLLKPITNERLATTVARLKQQLLQTPHDIHNVLDSLIQQLKHHQHIVNVSRSYTSRFKQM